jgi:tetratricopeptide (TPR) repeat protein
LLVYLGNHDLALAELQQGLERLPPGPSRLHITALGNLGNLHCIRGEIERGLAYYQRVIENAQKMNDYWAMVEVWSNLGIELDIAGRWVEALVQFQQALEQAERLGSLDQQARLLLARGRPYAKQGDYESAKSSFVKCISIARGQGWKALVIGAGNGLAEVHLGLSEIKEAEDWLTEVEQLAQATGVREQLPETYRYWALVRLAQGQPTEAMACAEQSVSLAREFQSYNDEGTGLRVLGQMQWANGQREAALASFEKSLQVLGDRDPYEAARTKVEWAKCLKSNGDAEQSATLSQVAQSAFRKLGARRDLANLEKGLTEPPRSS